VATNTQALDHWTRRPPFELMVTSSSTSEPTYHHPTPSTGRNPWRGMTAAVEHHPTFDILTPPRRAPTEQRRQRRTLVERQQQPTTRAKTQPRGTNNKMGESKQREHEAAARAGIYPSTVAPSKGSRRRQRRRHRLQKTRARFSPGGATNYNHMGRGRHRRLQGGKPHRRASPSIARSELCTFLLGGEGFVDPLLTVYM
jgi:hypothetical protein